MECFRFSLLVLLISNCGLLIRGVLSIHVQDSGHHDVVVFGTVLKFFLELVNDRDFAVKVTATADECCLDIDVNDTDCDLMILGRPILVYLEARSALANTSAEVNFYFRNLYTRYRIGSCLFMINSEPSNISLASSDVVAKSEVVQHPIPFDTTPANGTFNCSGIDQDPDRNCTPVDCAIKYRGKRNFFRNTTMKCEPVVECNTRGNDGVTITGYFDWENNLCIHFEWFTDDNYLELVESDTEIPAGIDPSQNKYYPDLEPEILRKSVNMSNYTLECNRGKQVGIRCKCDEGWKSSGIHRDMPTVYHWCDISIADPANITSSHAPKEMGGAEEIVVCIVLSIANLGLLIFWIFLLIKIVTLCPVLSKQ